MGARDYSEATRASLFAISLTCYEPDCQVPTVSIFGDGCKKNVQIAHIRAAKRNGPRYNPPGYPPMNDEQRAHFSNLILLCDLHHPLADKMVNEKKYTVDLLHDWKRIAEVDIRTKIDGLDRITESRLNDMLTDAVQNTKSQIDEAIEELTDISEGAAELLRTLYEKIESHFIDAESIALLHAAAQRLSYLEEGSHVLYAAAQQMGSLEENASTLASAARQLGHLEHNAGVLARAAVNLDAELLGVAADRLMEFARQYDELLHTKPRLPDIPGAIESAGDSLIARLEHKAESITIGEPTAVVDHPQRWRWGFIGFTSGVAFGVLGVMITVWILAANHRL
jgi:hypothetical protein